MKLSYVDILNYRSIKEFTINFDIACRVLVGINESGKSNVLKALRLLSPDFSASETDDLRERVGAEPGIKDAYVRFVFDLEKAETDQVITSVAEAVLTAETDREIVIYQGEALSIFEFCQLRSQGLYRVDILSGIRGARYWSLNADYKLAEGWKKPSSACPADYTVVVENEAKVVSSFKLVDEKSFPDIPKAYLENATASDLGDISGSAIIGVVNTNLPSVVFWEYDERHLLPNEIELEAFASDPSSCPPLRNMFMLADIDEDEIGDAIREAKKGSVNKIQNFLDRIADQTTRHFRAVWKEYRDIEFSLRYHGSTIAPGVKEANTHDFARRSDGFKRFVTFLLMISAKERSEQMQNALLLIDEPEISLHPSGARYLRDELIRIARRNYVVYSTHSIFMIDAANVQRHYIVNKKKEVTTLVQAKESNLADEEVLLNALGYSTFDALKPKNLIFEGYKDKRLFEVAIKAAPVELKTKFAGIGICHAVGVSSLKAITPLIELAKRECLIVSDCDGPAISEQKRYVKDGGYGKWLTYQEVDATIAAKTGEDFIKNAHIVAATNAVLARDLLALNEEDLPESGKLDAIKSWLIKKNQMTPDQARSTLAQVKDRIFDTLESKHVDSGYTKLLEGIDL